MVAPGFRYKIAAAYPLSLKLLPAFTPAQSRSRVAKIPKNQAYNTRSLRPTHWAEPVFSPSEAFTPVDIRAEMTLGDGLSARPLKN